MIHVSIMATVVGNPVVLVAPDTVQDYVTPAPPTVPVEPKVWCTQKVVGVFIGFIGLAIGVTCGVVFGVYYRGC
jgi:ABC-type transport system involved in cytochrome c biogenesis permease subunit